MHPGGIKHTAIHELGTFIVMAFYDIKIALIVALFECLGHYHIDWEKMNLNARFDLKSDNRI